MEQIISEEEVDKLTKFKGEVRSLTFKDERFNF